MVQSHLGISLADLSSGVPCWQGSMDGVNECKMLMFMVPSVQKRAQGVS